jgi:hypothetical protein
MNDATSRRHVVSAQRGMFFIIILTYIYIYVGLFTTTDSHSTERRHDGRAMIDSGLNNVSRVV